jgi:quercetin dioxygenase-like cupin family protein
MPVDANTKIEIYRIDFPPQAEAEQLASYYGEETIFVLDGELLVWVGDEQYTLTAGDSIHYDAIQPHGWCNVGEAGCSILWGRAASLSE